jgi:hypothetical protein
MKYLKTYEKITDSREFYYRLDNRSIDHIKASLIKIGLTPNYIINQKIMDNEANYIVENKKAFYVAKLFDKQYDVFWWNYSYSLDSYKGKVKYLGQIKISDHEINAIKYNL